MLGGWDADGPVTVTVSDDDRKLFDQFADLLSRLLKWHHFINAYGNAWLDAWIQLHPKELPNDGFFSLKMFNKSKLDNMIASAESIMKKLQSRVGVIQMHNYIKDKDFATRVVGWPYPPNRTQVMQKFLDPEPYKITPWDELPDYVQLRYKGYENTYKKERLPYQVMHSDWEQKQEQFYKDLMVGSKSPSVALTQMADTIRVVKKDLDYIVKRVDDETQLVDTRSGVVIKPKNIINN